MNSNLSTQLHNSFKQLMSDYAAVYEAVKANNDWKNSFRDIIAKTLPNLLCECASISSPYSVVGSYGKGRWTAVPWIAVFDTRITSSAQKGVYIVYLLNKDTSELYLTFEIAAKEAMGTKTNADGNVVFTGVVGNNSPELKEKLHERAEQIREAIQNTYFNEDTAINSGASGYDFGAVYYKRYQLESLPTGDILVEDLRRMMNIYKRYHDWIIAGEVKKADNNSAQKEGEEEVIDISAKDILGKIKNYIFACGFDYPDGLIENFYLSLKSKPFVILAGTSGTGKTRLVKLFAEAIGAAFKLVSVRPDWSDGSDLFGHTDLNGNFIPGPVCSAFDTAISDPLRPVFLCLDEMNLARVEYYLSDFLSVIESREKENGHIVTEGIAQYKNGIPENLYIIGTVNMDETTFPFSKKVLDRANTIEFSYVDLMPKQRTGEIFSPQELPNNFLRTEYLVLATDCVEDMKLVEKICVELQDLNGKLVKANAHVGFRVRDEIVFYMLNNEKAGNPLSYEQAMDNEIMQKILPRIQGSSMAIKTLLIDMFKFCMGSSSGIDADSGNVGEHMKTAAASAKYPESAKKIGYMMTRFEDDGFTSYWL